jgi:hypothetical protein
MTTPAASIGDVVYHVATAPRSERLLIVTFARWRSRARMCSTVATVVVPT